MAARSNGLPPCGFAVGGTKKGDLVLKVEKRARGKKVTVIPNVTGDATKLVRALQSLLGVGGTVRQAENRTFSVEVQGEQTTRVEKVLLDFQCIRGVSSSGLEDVRTRSDPKRTDSAVDRSAATKFLAQTQGGKPLSAEEERRRALEQEADFYGRLWATVGNSDMSDVWEESLSENLRVESESIPVTQELGDLNVSLKALGMLAECGRAIKEFWDTSGFTIQQFRKMALNPGAHLLDDGPGRRVVPSNLRSRQKLTDFRSGGARGGSYFSAPCSAIDEYEKGKARGKGEKDAAEHPVTDEDVKMIVKTEEEGWYTASLSYVAPLPIPKSRLPDNERQTVAKRALKSLQEPLNEALAGIETLLPGVTCQLDCNTFGLDLFLRECDFVFAPKKDTGKPPSTLDKEEMKLEKKLREILVLRRRKVEGEVLEKLQDEKIAKRQELFEQVAELKLRKAEKELLKIFKRSTQAFQETFWELEFPALYSEDSTDGDRGSRQQFGLFNESACEGPIVISSDGTRAESRSPQWVGVPLLLQVHNAEVGAFAVEVLEGLLRLGWAAPNAAIGDLGSSSGSFGFGGTGKKVTAGKFEAYGKPFTAGDVIHCEAEREGGRLKIGYAKNQEPLGLAFDVPDELKPTSGIVGVVCGKSFKARLLFAECVPLDEATGLENFTDYDPPLLAVALTDFRTEATDSEDQWELLTGETVHISSSDGEGWLFGYFLEPEDGAWLPVDSVRILGEDSAQDEGDDWGAPPVADFEACSAPDPIPGLQEWLQDLSLQKYSEGVAQWCTENGAVELEEVIECWEDLAVFLNLKPLERKRLEKAVKR